MRHAATIKVLTTGLLAGILSACGAPEPVALLDDLEAGWNVIEPGGDTTCSDGSPYRFFVRPGQPERLLLYFEGGGACWNGMSCDPDLEPTYVIDTEMTDPARANGILDFTNADNPFGDYSAVYAAYCTGDVYLGNRVTTYEVPEIEERAARQVTVRHNGLANVSAVLDFVYSRFLAPSEIFVTGSSAGSLPSPYFAMLVAENYETASIAQLGDGSGGYRREVLAAMPEEAWGTLDELRHLPEFADMTVGEFTFESLYVAAARRHPDITFAAFDHAEDDVQKQFLALGGYRAASLLDLILANQNDIRSEAANFRSYIADGDIHTILQRPEFYTQHVDGVRIRDWVAALAAGEPVEDVQCAPCDVPEFIGGDD